MHALGLTGTVDDTEGPGGSDLDASEHSWGGLDPSSSSPVLEVERYVSWVF